MTRESLNTALLLACLAALIYIGVVVSQKPNIHEIDRSFDKQFQYWGDHYAKRFAPRSPLAAPAESNAASLPLTDAGFARPSETGPDRSSAATANDAPAAADPQPADSRPAASTEPAEKQPD